MFQTNVVVRRTLSVAVIALSCSYSVVAVLNNRQVDLLWQALRLMPTRVSQNWLGISLGIFVFGCPQVFLYLRYGRKLNTARWLRNFAFSLYSVLIGWSGVFAYSLYLVVKQENSKLVESTPSPSAPTAEQNRLKELPRDQGSLRTQPKVVLVFKQSPILTERRKSHISRVIDSMYLYLTGLGFPLSSDCPPIGIAPGKVFHAAGVYPESVYYQYFLLPEDSVNDDDLIRWAYTSWVFSKISFDNPNWTTNTFDDQIFSQYYVSSFSGHRWGRNKMVDKLWSVRQKEGKAFTDRAMFYAFKVWYDHPESNRGLDADQIFLNKLSMGINVVSNGPEKYAEAIRLLNNTATTPSL